MPGSICSRSGAWLALVAHQPYLYGELSALENLLFFGKMYSVERAQERADELLRRVSLDRRAHGRVNTQRSRQEGLQLPAREAY